MMYGAAEDIWSDGYESGQQAFSDELLGALGFKGNGYSLDLEAILEIVDLKENAEEIYANYVKIQDEKRERRKAYYAKP